MVLVSPTLSFFFKFFFFFWVFCLDVSMCTMWVPDQKSWGPLELELWKPMSPHNRIWFLCKQYISEQPLQPPFLLLSREKKVKITKYNMKINNYPERGTQKVAKIQSPVLLFFCFLEIWFLDCFTRPRWTHIRYTPAFAEYGVTGRYHCLSANLWDSYQANRII